MSPATDGRAASTTGGQATRVTRDLSASRISDQVAIVGLGLIGGSLARALGTLPRPPRVVASSNSRTDLELAERAGVIAFGATDPTAILSGSGLVVYATPLDVTLRLLAEHRGRWTDGAAVTDVASLKAPVEAAMRELGASDRYTGAHPMAGGEGSGFGHSSADLFAGATVWLTGEGVEGGAVEALWRVTGARPRWTAAADHDRLMSWCSHLPQLASNALARVLEQAGHVPSNLGPGGADMVRLAGSSPDMWLPLLARSEAGDALRHLARAARELADALDRHDLEAVGDWMAANRAWRSDAATPPSETLDEPPVAAPDLAAAGAPQSPPPVPRRSPASRTASQDGGDIGRAEPPRHPGSPAK